MPRGGAGMTTTATEARTVAATQASAAAAEILSEYAQLLDLVEASEDWTLDEIRELLRPLTAEEEAALPPATDAEEAAAVALYLAAHGYMSSTKALAELLSDPLALFPIYEKPESDRDEPPGLAKTDTDGPLLHVAGFFATSAARTDRNNTRHPAVHIRAVTGVVGTGPTYRTVDLIVDSDIAGHLARILNACAARAVLDVVAGDTNG